MCPIYQLGSKITFSKCKGYPANTKSDLSYLINKSLKLPLFKTSIFSPDSCLPSIKLWKQAQPNSLAVKWSDLSKVIKSFLYYLHYMAFSTSSCSGNILGGLNIQDITFPTFA